VHWFWNIPVLFNCIVLRERERERERESPVKLFSLYVWREREGALREFREMLESCPFNLWRERERERERVCRGG
jgi:hypothetical protein